MKYKIRLRNIPLFYYMPKGAGRVFSPYFKILHFEANKEILKMDTPVPGFFLIVEGEVIVYSKDYKAELNRLKAGSVFGEMSLIDRLTASATLKTTNVPCVCVFCDRDNFHRVLLQKNSYSAAFYRGAAELLSERLRQQNFRVGEEIERIENLLCEGGYQESLFARLGKTKNSVKDTGISIFDKLEEIIPVIKFLERNTSGESLKAVEKIATNIGYLLKMDVQNFDIISQQIDLIHQYIENLRRVSTGQKLMEVSGDQNIFYVNPSGEKKIKK